MKRHTTLTIDAHLIEKTKALNVNLSGLFNDFLTGFVNQQNDNLAGINIELENIKRDQLQKKITDLQAELEACNTNIKKYNELLEEQKLKELEKEKARIANQENCAECSNYISEKAHKFPIGQICHACFMSATAENIKKWGQAKLAPGVENGKTTSTV